MNRAKLFWMLGVFITALAVFSGYVLYRVANSESRYDRVEGELTALTMKINGYRFDTGVLPQKLQGLLRDDGTPRWRGPYAKNRDLLDPWERAYHYEVLDLTSSQFRLFDLDGNDAVFRSMTSER